MAERIPIDIRDKVKSKRDVALLESALRTIANLKVTKKTAEESLKKANEEMVPLLQSFGLDKDAIALDGKIHFVMYGCNVTTSQDRLRTALLKYKVPVPAAKLIMEESKAKTEYTTIQTLEPKQKEDGNE